MNEITLYVFRISYMLVDLRDNLRTGRQESLIYCFDQYADLKEVTAPMIDHYKALGYRVINVKSIDVHKVAAALSDLLIEHVADF